MKINERKRQLFVYGAIGNSNGYVSADDVATALDKLGPGPVQIKVNSPGGDLMQGQLIRQLLRTQDGKITVVVDALAASAATMLLVEPSFERIIAPGAMTMIHEPWSTSSGTSSDFESAARTLKKFEQQLLDDYLRVMNVSRSELASMLADETWFTARESVAVGLVNRIDGTLPKVEPISGSLVDDYRHAPAALRKSAQTKSGTPKRDAAERRLQQSNGWSKADRLARAYGIARKAQQRQQWERKIAATIRGIQSGLEPAEAARRAR